MHLDDKSLRFQRMWTYRKEEEDKFFLLHANL